MARMNRPAPVEVSYKNMRFLITHNPTNATLSSFIEDLKKYGATTVVRVCEVTYDKAPLEKDGITVVGSSPRGAGPHREWDEVRGRHPVHPTEAARRHQQQTAHLPGKVPAEAETAVQGPPRAQDQVLHHVAQDAGAWPRAQQGSRHGASLCPLLPAPRAHPPPAVQPAPRTLRGCFLSLPTPAGVCVRAHVCMCAHCRLAQPSFCLHARVSVCLSLCLTCLCPQPSLSL
ncbi:protein tyrosine phosphatase type IVA 3 isoform X3 [Cervus elaphus]|uniref:protein tyrosine phosphatase type IVA 3 isoform X3 n=1 Tax=Cervus elaphus TaxID=9860 RepID=UPI001CC32392|nr:protein tyrosine phosphatase type IVA 3 isoform X3 [Cervus elaphus]XP_043736457.1 protein tyrosine phosphatase type IVA 3 isoform X3 [Cervus elaphus]XP_043736458.1 protein tyrosine phosphatase type IVA 3 isoform X3 [Cervus elaphus]XP_043736459.1 protein tyrosine phosphatase type IVA 3 isoform X3 [Cervus elaphus]